MGGKGGRTGKGRGDSWGGGGGCLAPVLLAPAPPLANRTHFNSNLRLAKKILHEIEGLARCYCSCSQFILLYSERGLEFLPVFCKEREPLFERE